MSNIQYINIDCLNAHPDNPRKDLGDLTEMAASIKAKGILQNLTVVPYYSDIKKRVIQGQYTIIIGHRRAAAARLAGLKELPCAVVEMTPQEQFETMMVENVQRNDLTVMEQAEGFQMMLDMGDTVEKVAAKTGFSETTIRRRLPLTRLDRKRVAKAEERGGTIGEYMQVAELEDDALRNKVLNKVGTPDFKEELKKAQDKEKLRRIVDRIRKELEQADWCTEIAGERTNLWQKYEYVTKYGKYGNGIELKTPEDAGKVPYYYCIDDDVSISIWTELKKEDTSLDIARAEKIAKIKEVAGELEAISDRHGEMRTEFVRDFRAVHNNESEIMEFAARVILQNASYYFDRNKVYEMIGAQECDKEAMERALFNRPQNVLFAAAFQRIGGGGQKYCNRAYFQRYSTMEYKKNDTLDMIYKALCSMGYEMTEEEKAMQDGSHSLFAEQAKLKKEIQEGA